MSATEMRQAMIERPQKVLTSYTRFDANLYEAITQDAESDAIFTATLKRMINALGEADDEAFLHAEESVENAERRRLEQFGI